MVTRGDIWLVTEASSTGNEIRKIRPWVVISPADVHDSLRTVIGAPLTTKIHPRRFRVPLTFQGKRGLILLDQLRALDKTRLIRKLGKASPAALGVALARLQAMFAE